MISFIINSSERNLNNSKHRVKESTSSITYLFHYHYVRMSRLISNALLTHLSEELKVDLMKVRRAFDSFSRGGNRSNDNGASGGNNNTSDAIPLHRLDHFTVILGYSDKSHAVFGSGTYDLRNELREQGFRFNKYLKFPSSGRLNHSGYLVEKEPATRLEQVRQLLAQTSKKVVELTREEYERLLKEKNVEVETPQRRVASNEHKEVQAPKSEPSKVEEEDDDLVIEEEDDEEEVEEVETPRPPPTPKKKPTTKKTAVSSAKRRQSPVKKAKKQEAPKKGNSTRATRKKVVASSSEEENESDSD